MTPRNREYDVQAADVPRHLFPSGRCRFSLGTRHPNQVKSRRAQMDRLRADHQWEVLHALSDGRLNVAEVCRVLSRQGQQAYPELRRKASQRPGSIPTVREEGARYLTWYAAKRSPQSERNTRSRLSRISEQEVTLAAGTGRAELGDVPLPEVTRGMLEEAIDQVAGTPGSRYNLQTAARGLWTWSIREERERARVRQEVPRWTVNPASLLEVPERRPRVETASEEQVLALLAAAELYQVAYLRVFVQIGLRRDELIHTRLHTDLDVRRWVWKVQPRGPDSRCGCLQCRSDAGWSPKTKRGIRTFGVPETPAQIREAIAAYLEVYPAEPGDFVFRNPRTERPWERTALRTDFKALCARAGVRYGRKTAGGITMHVLRHTAATNLVRAGQRESVVAALLGDTVQTVVSTYVHLDETDLARGIAAGPSYA